MDRLPWDVVRKSLLVLPGSGFNDHERRAVTAVISDAGLGIDLCSTRIGWLRPDDGPMLQVSLEPEAVEPSAYLAVAFIGGDWSADKTGLERASRLAKRVSGAGAVIGAICSGPLVLAGAGLLDMMRATCHPSYRRAIESAGAVFVAEPVVSAGWMVTAAGPTHSTDFARVLVSMALSRAPSPSCP